MKNRDSIIKKLREAYKTNNSQEFMSCAKELDQPDYGYAFTNLHQNVKENEWEEYRRFLNIVNENVRPDSNRGDRYKDIYIFLYMYPMFVVEEFFIVRQSKESLDKAYNEFLRRLEEGLNYLGKSSDRDRTTENRTRQKTYYERFVYSIIKNYENNMELKYNLLTYVYARAQFYRDDQKNGYYLGPEDITECLIEPVYKEFQNDNTFQGILDGLDDETYDYWINYGSALVDYKEKLRDRSTQPEKQTEAQTKVISEESSKKSSGAKTGNGHDGGDSGKVPGELFPTWPSRAIAIVCILSLIFNAALWIKSSTSSNSNNHGQGEATIETEHDNSATSTESREDVSGETQGAQDHSSSVPETESVTSDDSSTSNALGGSPQTNNDATESFKYLTVDREWFLRATPDASSDDNVITMIPGGAELKIYEELDESWFCVEYVSPEDENGMSHPYRRCGYVRYNMPNDDLSPQ